jgi:hypothetical protein
MLLDDVVQVLIDRVDSRQAGLLVLAHAQAVEVHRRCGVVDHRMASQGVELPSGGGVDGVGVGVRVCGEVDLGA